MARSRPCRARHRTTAQRPEPPWLELENHSRVAEDVGLDVLETEELRDALVVGAEQLFVDLGLDRGAIELDETVPTEELHLEREAEDAAHAEVARTVEQALEDRVPCAGAAH